GPLPRPYTSPVETGDHPELDESELLTGGPGVGNMPPVVEYTICDTSYTVSLTVTNPNGSDTETKVNYVRALCPASGCDTLFSHWNTPPSLPSIFGWAPFGFVTGYPAPPIQAAATTPVAYYEEYITPSPGTTTVGAMQVGLGAYLDADSNSTFQAVVYNADATGAPAGPPLGGLAGLNPGQDLGVPGGGFFFEFWLPFDKVTIDSATFLVGLEMFPGDAADSMAIISSGAGQGQALGLNHLTANLAPYFNFLVDVGIDFDLDIIPMLGSWQTEFFINGLAAVQSCDSTLLLITDSALFHGCLQSVEVNSTYGGTITDSTLAGVDSLFILYTQPGPDTISFTTINECGRTDTITYFLTYPFDTTPVPDFTMTNTNPICAGTFVFFNATPAGAASYTWDWGDGSPLQTVPGTAAGHVYATPGLYYVTLTVTDPSGCSETISKLDFVEIVDCSVTPSAADFTAMPDTGCIGQTTNFSDNSAIVPDPPTGWFWAFDDGTFSLLQNPTHVYTVPGTYNVMLVTSNAGGNDTTFRQVVIIGLPCSLPTDIVLSATPFRASVVLDWEVPSGSSPINFELERSLDGQNFSQLAAVNWSDYTSPNMYSFIDNDPGFDQRLYYRLKEIDQDGTVEYSNIAEATLSQGAEEWIKVYPNPVAEGRGLNIDAYLLNAGNVKVTMFDVMGREVVREDAAFAAGMGRFTIDTATLSEGTYFLRVASAQGVQVKKVIVE
ncbi:MAG: PKD domain-containing protein, partial [Bacteroidota bacterium]